MIPNLLARRRNLPPPAASRARTAISMMIRRWKTMKRLVAMERLIAMTIVPIALTIPPISRARSAVARARIRFAMVTGRKTVAASISESGLEAPDRL